MRIYPENFHAVNQVWHGVPGRGVGAAVTDAMLLPRTKLLKSIFHKDWNKPPGYHTVIGGLIDAADGSRTALMLPGRDEYPTDALRLFKTLSIHFRRAVQLNVRLAQGDADSDGTAALLQQGTKAALLVDADCHVLLANAAAEALFQRDQTLKLSKRALAAQDAAEKMTLQATIAGCARGDLIDCGGTVSVSVAAGPPLKLLVVPLCRRVPLLAPGYPAAIIFDTNQPALRDDLQRLRAEFGLTAAEAAFALEIIKGDGKRAAAERCNISFSTARTHLSRIFDKTGVRRQAELVRVLSRRESKDPH